MCFQSTDEGPRPRFNPFGTRASRAEKQKEKLEKMFFFFFCNGTGHMHDRDAHAWQEGARCTGPLGRTAGIARLLTDGCRKRRISGALGGKRKSTLSCLSPPPTPIPSPCYTRLFSLSALQEVANLMTSAPSLAAAVRQAAANENQSTRSKATTVIDHVLGTGDYTWGTTARDEPVNSMFKDMVYWAIRFPTPNPFFNLGVTGFFIYFVVKAITGSNYEAYLFSTIYTAVYLIGIAWANPRAVRS